MSPEDSKVDALYSIAREIKEARQEIAHRLGQIVSQLDDMKGYLSDINRSLPNPLDRA